HRIEADRGPFRDVYVTVNNGAADVAVASYVDVGKNDAGFHFAVGIDAHIGREYAVTHKAPGENAAGADDGIDGHAGAPGFAEDELGRRILPLFRADGPVTVIQVEHRRDRDQVHVGVIVSLNGPHVAPVLRLLHVLVDEIEGIEF